MALPNIFYRDLSLDPTVDSMGDISTVTNLDSIKQSLIMMLNTAKGTRIFLPDYGCRVKGFLFEPFDQNTATQIGTEIQETIKNYEPRVDIISINVNMLNQTTTYEIQVTYRVVNTQITDSFKITLDKL